MVSAQNLWAITSYFNPEHFRSRRFNYRVFRDRLSIPLVTVELATVGEFELESGDADICAGSGRATRSGRKSAFSTWRWTTCRPPARPSPG